MSEDPNASNNISLYCLDPQHTEIGSSDESGCTPLHLAVFIANEDTIAALIDAKADTTITVGHLCITPRVCVG